MNDETEVAEAEVVEEPTTEQPAGEEPTVELKADAVQVAGHSTELEVRAPSREVLMPLDTDQVVEGMKRYQEMLPQLLDDSDYQDAGGGKRFVKKSGWRKIARAFNLSTMVVSIYVERDPEGDALRAEAVVRAMAPNGQVSDADGYCSAEEQRFQKPKGRQKLENDLRATATTRAKNRAISDLVGMGEVSAEEMEQGGGVGLAEATDQEKEMLRNALGWLLPKDEAKAVWGEIKTAFGGELYGPACIAVAAAVRSRKVLEEGDGEVEPGKGGDDEKKS